MSKFIQCDLETESRARVSFVHYVPSQLPETVLATGILVEDIPEPEVIERKAPVLYFNPQTSELWYEYIDRPLTQEEQLADLAARQKATEDALLELLLSGGAA